MEKIVERKSFTQLSEQEKIYRYQQWKRKKNLYKKYQKRQELKNIFINSLLSIGIFSLFIGFIFLFFVAVIKVNGTDMKPELKVGEHVIVSRQEQVKRYMIVAYKPPKSKAIRVGRVIGLPKEDVIYKNDVLSINNQERSENFITQQLEAVHKSGVVYTPDFSIKSLTGKDEIPEKHYLILGDNRLYATDSRYYGLIKKQWIVGVVQ